MSKLIANKSWRDAATLIAVAKRNQDNSRNTIGSRCNYDVLLQTRTSTASFANTTVFPGGVAEPADASDEWLKLFKSFGFEHQHFNNFHKPNAPSTLLFRGNPIRKHISLRITAIREAFEELGIVLCSQQYYKDTNNLWANVIVDCDIKYWRNKISEDPNQFLNFCKEHKCYPDIWSLYYWSNWLTPAYISTRFNTGFFVTALKDKPSSISGNSEVKKFQWSSPIEILKKSSKQEVKLPPPQAYEFYRLSQLSDIENLITTAQQRSSLGDELFYPVFMQARDAKVILLPGDSCYPTNVDYHKESIDKTEKTALELRQNCETLHRLDIIKSKSTYSINNYKPKFIKINMDNVVIDFF